MPISNAEKQDRFRKKQELNKLKDQVFKEWQLGMGFRPRRETPDEIHALLEKAASLPSGWNEKDLKRAEHRIDQLRAEFLSPQDDLKKDVEDGAGLTEAFFNNPDPFGKLYIRYKQVHIKNTRPRIAFDFRVGAFSPLKLRTGGCSHGSCPPCGACYGELYRYGEI